MPYTIRKIPKRNCYKVSNKKTKRVFSACTSKKNALSQLRLLRAIENNKNFVPRNRTMKKGMNKTMRK